MIPVKFTLYQFDELSDDIKKQLIDQCKDGGLALPDEWYEDTIENWETKLIEIGFLNPLIKFSGFYSQGDGASFDAEIAIEKFINKESEVEKNICGQILSDELPNFVIRKREFANHYCHEKTREVYHNFEHKDPNLVLLQAKIEAIRLEKSKEIYLDLRSEYESWFTDEAAKEYLSEQKDTYYFKNGMEFCFDFETIGITIE